MVFLFYGQTKSLIRCGHCHRDKVNYGVFSSLSMPIPNSNTLLLPVIVNQIPSELYAILKSYLD